MSHARAPFILAAFSALALAVAHAAEPLASEPRILRATAARPDLNGIIRETLEAMPRGGHYSVSRLSFTGLGRAITLGAQGLVIQPTAAQPSFCSGATYLVFVQTLERLQREGALNLDRETLTALPVTGQRDGQGIWGRWNANGPGTARLFSELQLGRNFTDYAEARTGDFMKIFWTDEIGQRERGHSVIFLSAVSGGAQQFVRFWSSNLPSVKGDTSGYGEKIVARSKIARVIFSRLEQPGNISRARTLPNTDPFLASMLTRRADIDEVRRMCGF